MYNQRLQKKIREFLLEADPGQPKRTYNKLGAYSKMKTAWTDKPVSFQDAAVFGGKTSAGKYKSAEEFARKLELRNEIKVLKKKLDKSKSVDEVAALNQQINDIRAMIEEIEKANAIENPYLSDADKAIQSQIGQLSPATVIEEPTEEDLEIDRQIEAERQKRLADADELARKYSTPEDYAENEAYQARAQKGYYNMSTDQSSGGPQDLVSDANLADKIIDYTDSINRMEKLIKSKAYSLENLNKPATEIVDEAINIPIEKYPTNIDQFEQLIDLLAGMYVKLITSEHNLVLQQSDDKSRANKLQQYDLKSAEVNNKLVDLATFVKSMISNKVAAKYPDLAQRLAILARQVDKVRNKENMAEKKRFFNYETIADASQYWSGVSGVKQAIAPMLQQATWIQQLLRTNTLADMKTITFEKFVETIDDVYNISLGFKNSDAVSLQQKLEAIQDKIEEEGDLEKDSKTEKKVLNNPELKAKLMQDPTYRKLVQDKKDYLEELAEYEDTRDIYGPEDAAMAGIDYSDLLRKINMVKSAISDINNQITKLELSVMKDNAGKKVKKMDKKSKDAAENLRHAISQADIWDKKSYSPIKGKKGEYEAKEFEKFGNIKNPEYNPDFLLNKARIVDPKTGKADIDFIKKMGDFYEYPNSTEEYNLVDPSSRYLQALGNDAQIGRGVDPMFMQRLMNDNTSPYRQFNSLLIGEFFDKEKTKDYKEGVRNAILRWMQTYYNRRFGQADDDEKLINKISFYTFGLENANLEPDEGFVEQKPEEFIEDIQNYFNKISGKGTFNTLTPPGPTLGREFYTDTAARQAFFQKICDEATITNDPGNPLGLKKRSGAFIGAALRNLYDENVVDYFTDFVEDLGKAKLKVFLEKSFHASEFYETYGNVIASPEKA